MHFKNNGMKVLYSFFVLAAISVVTGCEASSKEKKSDLNDKLVELQKLKDQQSKLADKISNLEAEIVKLNPNAIAAKPKLVSITVLNTKNFAHYIDLQGRVDAENIVYVMPRGQGGQVKGVYVQLGDAVKKGQLIMKLDDAVQLQNIQQAQVQLDLAKSTYQRRKNLWDQNIGSEQEFLNAKADVDAKQKGIDILKEQLDMTNVYAEMSGIVDVLTTRVGDVVSPQTAAQQASGQQGIRIVNGSTLKAVVDVPEVYLSNVKKGTPVVVDVPDVSKSFNSSISTVSQVINATSRGFLAEAKLPASQNLKPNQVAMIHIQDYTASNAVTVPLNAVQTDQNGKYVYLMVTENGKTIAKKQPVNVGEINGDQIEIKKGLSSGDKLISEGYQSVYDGQLVTTEAK
jgi:RND family efflux transporter MFP subunit